MLTQDNYVKGRLVSYGWRFGQSYGGGHLAGQMVMHTLANRVRLGWGSWLRVLDTIPLSMAENELPPLEHPSVWEPTFIKLLSAVDGIFDGSVPDMTRGAHSENKTGALYFGALNKIERPWFKQMIAATNPVTGQRIHQRCADMNTLSFWD